MKKFFAVLTALILLVICTSCTKVVICIPEKYIPVFNRSGAPAAQTDTSVPSTDSSVVTPVETQAQQSETPTQGSQQSEQPSSGASTETPTSAPSSGAPSTKEEVIAYYVACYNKIATDSKSVVRNFDSTTQYNNILNINGNKFLQTLAEKLMGMFMGPTDPDVAMTADDIHPKGVKSLSISPSQIKNATCKDNGSTYVITMTSTGTDDNYEIDAQPGKGSAGVIGPLLRTEDVTGAAGSFLSFEGLHAYYPTCTVVATVDKASGHITNFDFNSPCVLHFDKVDAKIAKVENCDIGLLFEQKWTVTY